MIPGNSASVSVVPLSMGREYEVVRAEAAMAGVRCEIADGNEIPNLGEKLMQIVTREETWRGLNIEVVDVASALKSIRTLVKTGHNVVFGDGANGNEHYIDKYDAGEVNCVEQDGECF